LRRTLHVDAHRHAHGRILDPAAAARQTST
jgi:hypothetical protein